MRAEVPGNPICLAIDTTEKQKIEQLVAGTRAHVGMFKLGITSLYGLGTSVVREVDWQRPLFLDAKLHDIPAQVEGAAAALGALGASFVTVHASGGTDMVRAAVEGAGEGVAVLAVTILTSLDQPDLDEMGFATPTATVVRNLAELAIAGGAHGLVCSAHEVADLRTHFGPRSAGGPILVVPGIRPIDADKQDQRRTMAPREAVAAGADILVIGRPISGAPDPAAAASAIGKDVAA